MLGIPDIVLIAVLLIASIIFGFLGLRTLIKVFKNMEDEHAPESFYRGGRGVISAVALIFIAAGLHFDSNSILVFGLVFLAEELYETIMAESIMRWGRKQNQMESS